MGTSAATNAAIKRAAVENLMARKEALKRAKIGGSEVSSEPSITPETPPFLQLMLDLPKSRVFNVGYRPVNHEVEGNVICAGNVDGSLKLHPWFIFESLENAWVDEMQNHLNPESAPKSQKLKEQVQQTAMAMCAKLWDKIPAATTDEERAEARKTYNDALEKARHRLYKQKVFVNPCQLTSSYKPHLKEGEHYMEDSELKVPQILEQSEEWALLREKSKLKPAEKKAMLKKLAHEDDQNAPLTGPADVGTFRILQQEKGNIDEVILACWIAYFYKTVNPTEDNPAMLTVPRIPAFKKILEHVNDWDMKHLTICYMGIKDSVMDALIIPQARRDAKNMATRGQTYGIRMDGSKPRVRPIHALNYLNKSFTDFYPREWGKQWGMRPGSPYFVPEEPKKKQPYRKDYYYYKEQEQLKKARRALPVVHADKVVSSATEEQLQALSSNGTPETAAKWAETREKSMAEVNAALKEEQDKIDAICKETTDYLAEAARKKAAQEKEWAAARAKKEAERKAQEAEKARVREEKVKKHLEQQRQAQALQQQRRAQQQQRQMPPQQQQQQRQVPGQAQQRPPQGQPQRQAPPQGQAPQGQFRQYQPQQGHPQGPQGHPQGPPQGYPGHPGHPGHPQFPPQGYHGPPPGHFQPMQPGHQQMFHGPPPMGFQQMPPRMNPIPQGAPMYQPQMQQQQFAPQQRAPLGPLPAQSFNHPPQGQAQKAPQAPQAQPQGAPRPAPAQK